MTRLRGGLLLIMMPLLVSAKNFGPDITPLEFFLSFFLLIIIGILFFGGPFGGYYWLTSRRWWLKGVAVLSVLVNLAILILCITIPIDLFYLVILSIWILLTCLSFFLGIKKAIRIYGKRN